MDKLQIITILTSGLAAFFGAYLSRKGRNQADKEDITKITKSIEDVKHSFSSQLEELKAVHQLRMAAIEKRIQVHQEAFTHWSILMKEFNNDKFLESHHEASDWWDKNCLYLSESVRDEFVNFISQRKLWHESPEHRSSNSENKYWETCFKLPNRIFEEVNLPKMSQKSLEIIINK